MNDMTPISGVELPTAADHATDDLDTAPRKPRGFAANPEALARAVETRQKNKLLRANAQALPGTGESDAGSSDKRSGGRPSGGSKRDRNLQGVEQMLLAIHMMVATATGVPEFAIDQAESHVLADALANLGDHYKINISGKPGAVLGVIYAAGIVYGPRAVALFVKSRKQAQAAHGGNPDTGAE